MDAISYSYADKQAKRVKKIINDPDSTSGVVTVPSVIAAGETITIPAGRTAVLPNVQIDGTLNVDGTVFIPTGTTTSKVIPRVTSTDNAIVRFDGVTGAVQNSGVIIDDNGNVGIGVIPSASTLPTIQSQYNIIAGQEESNISVNAYYSGGVFKYIANGYASRLYQDKTYGAYQFLTAPSGTAGNAITWTNAMTLGSNGNLLVGTTVDNGIDKLQVSGSITHMASKYKYINLNDACNVSETTIVNNNCANIPYNDYGYVTISVSFANSYCMQTFTGLNSPARLFIRLMVNGGWSPWLEK